MNYLDLPYESANGEQPYLLDASAGFAVQVEQGAGYVWTERYVQLKTYFDPLEVGIESTVRPDYYLVNEQQFRDIGGGFWEWDRRYANVPSAWDETLQLAFNYTQERSVVTTGGDEPGVETFSTSKSAQVSVKAAYTYQIGYPDTAAAISLSDPVYTAGATVAAGTTVRPTEVERYLGNIWRIANYTLLKSFTA